MAFLKPAVSKASFQPSIPATTKGFISSGVDFSTQNVIGFTGSEISWSGNFFSSLHRLMTYREGYL